MNAKGLDTGLQKEEPTGGEEATCGGKDKGLVLSTRDCTGRDSEHCGAKKAMVPRGMLLSSTGDDVERNLLETLSACFLACLSPTEDSRGLDMQDLVY